MPTQHDSNRSKKDVLTGLKDEVRDFHPLLDKLLSKLPRVLNVAYTHGAQEKGADFVVCRQDDILVDHEYVGVIAKVGKIHQDMSKIEQQIDECDEDRLLGNGKQKIRLNEIWIITNEFITQGAREKIYRKYSTRKIKFIDCDNVCKWVDDYIPNYWHSINPVVAEYLQLILAELNEADKLHCLIPNKTNDFYVEQDLRKIELKYGIKNKVNDKPVKKSILQTIAEHHITFIEGGAGTGKSQMLRNAARHYTNTTIYLDTQYIPIYIDFRTLCNKWGVDVRALANDKLTGRVSNNDPEIKKLIIFVDAIDEHNLEHQEALEHLKKLVADIQGMPDCKAVLSTRPIDQINYDSILPADAGRYEIAPLSMKKVGEFIRHICKRERISDRLIDDLHKSLLFRQMPMTPISAILLAHLVNDSSKELPSNLTELYQRYSELMLGRWDMQKGLESQKEFEAARNIVMEVARYSVDNKLDELSEAEVLDMFKSYLDARNLSIDPKVLYDRVTTRSGILQKHPRCNTVAFKHLSFAEFFYAMHKDAHYDDNFVCERIYDPDWKNVYFFYIGMKKDCEDVLRKMLSQPTKEADDKFFRIMHFGDYLLAAYTTPYVVVEDAIEKIMLEAADFYDGVINGSIDCALKRATPIRLLELLKLFVSSCYAFEFFVKAMDTAAVRLLENKNLGVVRQSYALFFLATVYIMLRKPNPFSGLLEHIVENDSVPFPVQFGLMYETEAVDCHSALIKRQNKKLMQAVKKSKQFNDYAIELHISPVHELIKRDAARKLRIKND